MTDNPDHPWASAPPVVSDFAQNGGAEAIVEAIEAYGEFDLEDETADSNDTPIAVVFKDIASGKRVRITIEEAT